MLQAVKKNLAEVRGRWCPFALCLGVGLVGALIFVYLRLPLPWMLGSLIFAAAAALAGVELWVPRWFRTLLFIILGAMFGTTVKPELGAHIVAWIPTMIAVLAYVAAAMAVAFLYLRRVAGHDPITAYFSAAPGGLIQMTVIGAEYGGDERVISLMQTTRLMITVIVVPFGFQIFTDYAPTGAVGTSANVADLVPRDAALMAAACIVSIPFARLARLPSPFLLGPMIAVAALTVSGAVTSEVPDPLVAFAQWIIGASVGAMFSGVQARAVAATLGHAAVSGLMMIVMAVVVAVAVGEFTHVDPRALVLGFSPGGIAEMALIAFALGIEVPFVVGHQIIRIFIIVGLLPFVMWMVRRPESR